jgi:hypothetical protein
MMLNEKSTESRGSSFCCFCRRGQKLCCCEVVDEIKESGIGRRRCKLADRSTVENLVRK